MITFERRNTAGTEPVAESAPALPRRHAWRLAVAWPLALIVFPMLEPAPADPEAAAGALVAAVSTVFMVTLLVMTVALAAGHRAAALASLGGAGILLGTTVACPLTGHHGVEWWWFAQLAIVATLAHLSISALRRPV